jgi:hypothetical protein
MVGCRQVAYKRQNSVQPEAVGCAGCTLEHKQAEDRRQKYLHHKNGSLYLNAVQAISNTAIDLKSRVYDKMSFCFSGLMTFCRFLFPEYVTKGCFQALVRELMIVDYPAAVKIAVPDG